MEKFTNSENAYFAQKYTMTGYDHFMKLLILVGFILAGLVATVMVSGIVLASTGMTLADIAQLSESGMEDLPASTMRLLLTVQHACIFLLPGLLFGLVTYKSGIWRGLDLSKSPPFTLACLGIFFLVAAYPLVNLSFLLNEAVPLPSWVDELENQASDTLKSILDMPTPLIFFFNLLLIAILPGIGEELIFRGIVQKHIGGWLKNPIVAIWLSAFIFSAIHMQFEGFLPRIVLGAVLGYLYYWTNNLWVPIIAHAFNNGIQVVLIYVFGLELEEVEQQGTDLQWWMIILSVAAMFGIAHLISKHRNS